MKTRRIGCLLMVLMLAVSLCVPAIGAEQTAVPKEQTAAEETEAIHEASGDSESTLTTVNATKMKVTASKTVKAGLGEKVSFTAKVTKSSGKVTYQWQYSTNGKKWANTKEKGAKTKKLTLTVDEDTFRKQYRCVAKDKKGTANSNVVKVEKPFALTVSPANQKLAVGKTAKFTAKAKGTTGSVKYQWMYSTDGGKKGEKTTLSGAKKANLKPKVTNEVYGYLFRCEVTDKNGKLITDTVYVEPVNGADFSYKKSGTAWILTGYKGKDTAVTLPAGHQGMKVTSVKASAFKGNKKIKSVVIPMAITSIGASAFETCAALTTVTLSDAVTEIGKACFKNCKKLKDMKIKNE